MVIDLRLRNVKNKDEILKNTTYLITDPKEYKSKWNDVFNNHNKIYIEVGMGKGDFIIENAKRYPNINFIGIEKYDSVIARAIEKANLEELPNLKLVRMDANFIEEAFYKEVDLIYLNFSDPWPKKRHAKKRLTSEVFLNKYDTIFKSEPYIIMKTDNMQLFEYSLESFSKYGYTIEKVSLDLHNSDIENNIETEYEKKFSSKGNNIYFLEVKKIVNKSK